MRQLSHTLLAVAALAALTPEVLHATGIEVQGTQLLVTDPVGKRLSAAQLVGTELDLPAVGTIRVVAVEADPIARFQPTWLHTLELRAAGETEFRGFCEPDPSGDRRVVLYPGYFDQSRRYVADKERFSMSCVSGVEAKCLRWGYLPWKQAPATGESLAPYFEACIQLARADYCGDDRPTTRNGTTIDVYDRVGVQQPEADPGELRFEAGWAAQGAVCVAHTRIVEEVSLKALPQHCPRLVPDDLGASCTEESARERGAILYNRSR